MDILPGALMAIAFVALCVGVGAAVRSIVQELLEGGPDDDPDAPGGS